MLHYIHHGRVGVAPAIERFDGHDVHFVDGTARPIDTILYATGFQATLPFLDRALLRLIGKAALVTGSARGQGAAHGRRLAEDGAAVLLADILDVTGAEIAVVGGYLAR